MKNPPPENWLSDWQDFVRAVASEYNHGLSDSNVTSIFAEQEVIWLGTLGEKHLDPERPRIVMSMPSVEFRLSDGRHSTVDYLNLAIDDAPLPPWNDVPSGALIRFKTFITLGKCPFPGLQLSNLDEQRCVLLIATQGSEFVDYA